jgi:hypothetical protein
MLSKAKALVARPLLGLGSDRGFSSLKPVARRKAISATPLALALILVVPNAEATPRLARETGKTCNFCHRGPPRLNDTGLAFKNDGFRFPNSGEAPDKDHKEASPQ